MSTAEAKKPGRRLVFPGIGGEAGPRTPESRSRLGGWWPWLVVAAVLVLVLVLLVSRNAGTAGARLSLPRPGALALLPFVNASGSASVDWVEHGLMTVVAAGLERTPGIELIDSRRLGEELGRRLHDGSTEQGSNAQQGLARALGAEFVAQVKVSRRDGGLLAELVVFEADAEIGRASLAGETPVALADALIALLTRAAGSDLEPPTVAGLYTASPFLLRLYAMGIEAQADDQYRAAVRHFETCLETEPGFVAARAGLARAQGSLGQREESAELWTAVLLAGQERGDLRWQAEAMSGLAELAVLAGRLEQAEDLQLQARGQLERRADKRSLLELVRSQARLALTRGQRQRAEELFFERLQMEQELGDLLGQADSMLQLGSLAVDRDLAAAAELFGETRQLARRFDDAELEHRALASLGEVLRKQGKLQAAEESWRGALAYRLRHGDRGHQRVLLRRLAELALERGDLDSAEERWEDLLELSEELDIQADIGIASLRLARISLRRGYPFQARDHLDRALALEGWNGEPIESQRLIAWLAYERGHYLLALDTQRAVRRQAGERFSAEDGEFLRVYVLAAERGERLTLPGEPGYRSSAGGTS